MLCLFHSPCYIDKDSDLEVAAKRLCWGKFANSGQVQLHLRIQREKATISLRTARPASPERFFSLCFFFFLRTSAHDANPFMSLKWLVSSDFIFRWTGNNYCVSYQK